MKTFTSLRKLSFLLTVVFLSATVMAQTATLSPASTSIASGGSVNFTVTTTGLGANNDNRTFVWTITGPGATSPAGPVTTNCTSACNSQTQSFTFTTTGTYTVSVTVTQTQNGSAVATTSTTVSVYTANAGSDKLVGVNSTTLGGSAGGPGIISYAWTQQSGPNTATISNSGTSVASLSNLAQGTYVFRLTVNGVATDDVSLRYIPGTNLWATSSSGAQISSFSVTNGASSSGPDNMFAASFPGTTTGGTTTAALGRNDQPSQTTGYYYWLPNTTGNNGTVEIFASSATGNNVTRIGSTDLNGGSTNSLGYVRLGMGPDGTGWILAGDGTNLFLAKFNANGVNPVTITTVPVSLSGGTISTFQNGDLCLSGNNNIYALANNGSGTTQIFIGSASNPTVTLTKKWDLVDQNGAAFTGTVNGVAFDALGSLYISTSTGLFYINQNTVNTANGTVQCSLVTSVTGLQDLSSNVFPQQSTLPVKMVYFKGNLSNNTVNLSWLSATEENISSYTIQRSFNGTDFTDAGSVNAAGAGHNYSFADPVQGNPARIYYRLKIAERTGYSYSTVVLIRPDQKAGVITIAPNPFSDKIQFSISSSADANMSYKLISMDGKQLKAGMDKLSKGTNTFFINDLNSLQPGIYMLSVQVDGQVQTAKLIKK